MKTYKMPEESVCCVAEDYIIKEVKRGTWGIFLVESVVLLDHLAPVKADGSEFVEEIHFRDSTLPRDWGQIQLIITAFQSEYSSEAKAIDAIKSNQLADGMQGLCRNAQFFPKEKSKIYKKKQ